MLTNDIVSFEQPGPAFYLLTYLEEGIVLCLFMYMILIEVFYNSEHIILLVLVS